MDLKLAARDSLITGVKYRKGVAALTFFEKARIDTKESLNWSAPGHKPTQSPLTGLSDIAPITRLEWGFCVI